jgi:hypothetical protein
VVQETMRAFAAHLQNGRFATAAARGSLRARLFQMAHVTRPCLQAWDGAVQPIRFGLDDLEMSDTFQFSADGRCLVFDTGSGTVLLADIAQVREKLSRLGRR